MPPRASLTPGGEFICPGWSSGPIAVARSFSQRWRGLRPRPDAFGLLLKSRSVHSFGMKATLLVIALDAAGVVLATKALPPGRMLTMFDARHILELPGDAQPPPLGAVLTWNGAGTPDPLRNPHR